MHIDFVSNFLSSSECDIPMTGVNIKLDPVHPLKAALCIKISLFRNEIKSSNNLFISNRFSCIKRNDHSISLDCKLQCTLYEVILLKETEHHVRVCF